MRADGEKFKEESLDIDQCFMVRLAVGRSLESVHNANTLIGERLRTEATASLPGIIEAPSSETIFDGMEFQRLRLHHDQQVPGRE